MTPHSCGQTCGKKKSPHCNHSPCALNCHPGSCQPCNSNVTIMCHCGKEDKFIPCQYSMKYKYACTKVCNKLLNCKSHHCQKMCHEGECEPCRINQEVPCFCGNTLSVKLCGAEPEECKGTCNKVLECGHHKCESTCHSGACGPCPLDPEITSTCPCGSNLVESLIKKARTSCTDPLPVCD